MLEGTRITVDSKPEPLDIDIARTAVIVVDMQNDFGAEGGIFHRAGVDIVDIQAVVKPTAEVLDAARTAGMKVIYLKMTLVRQVDRSQSESTQGVLLPRPSPTRTCGQAARGANDGSR
jgi:nicotinamidase-related amidase